MKPIIRWISDYELNTIYSSNYWNDLEQEIKKPWWINSTDEKDSLLNYLHSSGLLDEYQAAENIIKKINSEKLVVADLAAGTGWASAMLTQLSQVTTVHAVEISKHRIGDLFERTFKILGGDSTKLNRYLGSFYNLRFDDHSLDVVFLSQAFHHADQPFLLLQEIQRILRSGGIALLLGEHHITLPKIIRRIIKMLLKEGRLITNFYELFPTDPSLGDHYYRNSDYYFMAKSLGFIISVNWLKSGNAMYVLTKP